MPRNDATMMHRPLLIKTLMARGPSQQADNLIITKTSTGYNTVTYREHTARTFQLGHALKASGVERGDNVATMMWNSARHLQCFHAIPAMGACVHTLNVRLGPRELGFIIKHAADSVLIVDHDLVSRIEACSPEHLASVRLFVVCGADEKPGGWSAPVLEKLGVPVVDFDAWLAPHPTVGEWPDDIDENSSMALCYTSGTTGDPKGVAYSHRSTYVHTLTFVMPDCLGISGTDVVFPVTPMFHALGWGLPYMCLMLGCRMVFSSRYNDPATVLKCCVDHGVLLTAAVPTVWQTVRGTLAAKPEDYKGRFIVDRIMCGGSSPPPEMMGWYKDQYGCEFVQVYGLTETNPLMTVARFKTKYEHRKWTEAQQFQSVTKAGVISPGVEVKLVSPEDYSKEVPQDGKSVGELLTRGATITGSYYRNPKVGNFPDGWMATGDIASVDAGGVVTISDRAKDLIKSGGEWISSIDIEVAVTAVQGVAQCSVVGIPHPRWDERPVAVVVPHAGKTVTTEQVRKSLSKGFAKYQLPDEVLIWKELPMTGTGKIDKKLIRKMLAEQGYKLPDLRTAKL